MLTSTIKRLQFLCDTIPPLLHKMDDQTFSTKPSPEKWSKKQIIGHLIDSAANNHHRMVRGQFDNTPNITYDQNKWNEHGYYQDMDKDQVISFWSIYNQQLLELIKRIPAEKLNNKIEIGESNHNLVTLQFIIEDYVVHMEHHLKQVVEY